jgi:pimeloyl-ACP methyl ester carboxylesterase
VAHKLNERCHATLLQDLLTPEEEVVDTQTGELRFNINFLTKRLIGATEWAWEDSPVSSFRAGYFGASTGAAAALNAAAQLGDRILAVVSRGGRPDMARNLPQVSAPTLLIVGGRDYPVIDMNREAYELMTDKRELIVIPGATHLFEEPGALERVAELAGDWFSTYLRAAECRASR